MVNEVTGCWVWLSPAPDGYGRFWYQRTMQVAHRVSYELYVGTVPPGLVLDHLCETRFCVCPTHLEPVTYSENRQRAELSLRSRRVAA